MLVKFLLGAAGSGKTYRCLEEARVALNQSTDGLPLLFIAPKQATYQLERQLLDPASGAVDLAGFTRLSIVSFERLARSILVLTGRGEPQLLSEEGRVMVLRALLSQHESELNLFRASARATGFAQELSRLFGELRQSRCSSRHLKALIKRVGAGNRLKDKLSDLALLLGEYEKWLAKEGLKDADQLLELASAALEQAASPQFEAVWLDGFARLSAQERAFLKALAPHCAKMTLAFCLDQQRVDDPWHSHWHAVGATVRALKDDLQSLKGVLLEVEELGRTPSYGSTSSRFSTSTELAHLERYWAEPKPYGNGPSSTQSVRLVQCADREAEAIFAAREILRSVRQGARFRDTAVLVRQLDDYHDILRRVFLRYEIPFFLDRREPIAHHPLAEVTRAALRTIAFNWRRHDWFCALKSGLVPASQTEIDRLENLALARGWEGTAWQNPLTIRTDSALSESVERLRQTLIRPFLDLSKSLGNHPAGKQLSQAISAFWKDLSVERQLEKWSAQSSDTGRVHLTVWEQLQEWLRMVALAFGSQSRPLKEWLPIVDAGLNALSIGAVPPVLDQVLLGGVDRSRNPDLQSVFVLGLNEAVFPARVPLSPILSDDDRDLLENDGLVIGQNRRLQAAQERFFGYIACTRARQRLTMTYALRDTQGAALNPSSLVAHVQRLFPQLREPELFAAEVPWEKAEHYSELISPLLEARIRSQESGVSSQGAGVSVSQAQAMAGLAEFPKLVSILDRFASPVAPELSPALAQSLYGPVNTTSVSALEKFGSCPFWFFVEHGLRAEERKRFELDARQRGTFQHQVLERFHDRLKQQARTWHSVTREEGRATLSKIADEIMEDFQEGMLLATPQNRFVANHQKERLQQLIDVLIGWMNQYEFKPAEVELQFGLPESQLPPWKIDLQGGRTLALRGSIDRVDLYREKGSDEMLCVVMDYKSSAKEIDRVLMKHGIQLQLPAYLAALRAMPAAAQLLSAAELRPVGVFFVNLRGKYESADNRDEVLGDSVSAHKNAFQHAGLFDAEAVDLLDNRNAASGDQFAYTRKLDGTLSAQIKTAMPTSEFTELLDETEERIREFGERIYQGNIAIDPFKKGALHACGRCHHSAICRIDPWTHPFRNLKKEASA